MDREYFSGNPIKLDVSRSKYHVAPRWTGSWNVGRLVPIFATSLILPGDTFKMRISSAVRTTTPITAIMDDMDMQIECWFVPHHLIMSREYMSPSTSDSNRSWAAFIGAQDSLLNMPLPGSVQLPKVNIHRGSGQYRVGGVADCLGFPEGTGMPYSVNFLKFAAYYAVWNEAYREPNTMDPVTYSISGGIAAFVGTDAHVDGTYLANSELAPTCRYHGYFGSALPWPQRNSVSVELPLGDKAPVAPYGVSLHKGNEALRLGDSSYNVHGATLLWNDTNGFTNFETYDATDPGPAVGSSNLFADLSAATAATINQFRQMVQLQRWFEQLSRSGNREGEITYGMMGVRGNDEGLRRPEYLGGKRIPIIQSQVPATGNATVSGSGTASLGTVGAFSLTNDSDYYFTKSFTTWGTLLVVMTCRTRESFANGLQREDSKLERFDYYWPQFANLGEQPILKKELVVTGGGPIDNDVFGYQEAWAEYRMFNDLVTGYVRPQVSNGLRYMTYANNFASAPTLKGYLNAENQQANVDRTLQVASSTSGLTFYGQFQFDIDMVRPMPLYSIPGLVDHH